MDPFDQGPYKQFFVIYSVYWIYDTPAVITKFYSIVTHQPTTKNNSFPPIYNFFLPRSTFSFIFTIARSASQKGRGQQATIKLQVQVQVWKIPKNLSCDWSMRFMKVIFLGLSLVRTSLLYKDWTTVICSCVCALCRQK